MPRNSRQKKICDAINHAAFVFSTFLSNLQIFCQVRRFLARRKFKKLKAEARSVEHVKQLNKGLENKIISLQQRLGDLQLENKQMVHLQKDMEDLR